MEKTTIQLKKRKERGYQAPPFEENDIPLVAPIICASCGQPVTRVLGTTPSCAMILLCESCWKMQVMNLRVVKLKKKTRTVDYLG